MSIYQPIYFGTITNETETHFNQLNSLIKKENWSSLIDYFKSSSVLSDAHICDKLIEKVFYQKNKTLLNIILDYIPASLLLHTDNNFYRSNVLLHGLAINCIDYADVFESVFHKINSLKPLTNKQLHILFYDNLRFCNRKASIFLKKYYDEHDLVFDDHEFVYKLIRNNDVNMFKFCHQQLKLINQEQLHEYAKEIFKFCENIQFLRYFYEQGVDLTSHDNMAFKYCAKVSSPTKLKSLIDLGVSFRSENDLAIINACKNKKMPALYYLFDLYMDLYINHNDKKIIAILDKIFKPYRKSKNQKMIDFLQKYDKFLLAVSLDNSLDSSEFKENRFKL